MKKPQYRMKAVYTGRRIYQSGKVYQRFERRDGTEMLFRGLRGLQIGCTYACGAKNIALRPERLDVEQIDNPKWGAQDALVDAHYAQKRADAALARNGRKNLRQVIEVLRPVCKGLPYFELKALIQYLVDRAGSK